MESLAPFFVPAALVVIAFFLFKKLFRLAIFLVVVGVGVVLLESAGISIIPMVTEAVSVLDAELLQRVIAFLSEIFTF